MTNPNDTLNTLWEMSEQGTKEWWDECVMPTRQSDLSKGWKLYGQKVFAQHALAILRDSCERWLVGKGPWPSDACWEHDLERDIYSLVEHDYPECTSFMFEGSLTEAIEYAMGQSTTS